MQYELAVTDHIRRVGRNACHIRNRWESHLPIRFITTTFFRGDNNRCLSPVIQAVVVGFLVS